MRRLLAVLLPVLLLVVACDERPDVWEEDRKQTMEEDEVRALVAKLAVAEQALAGDVEAELDYEDLVAELKLQGVGIEPVLIEELNRTESWAVRFGLIDVLVAIGTKASTGAMLAALQDEHPRVAWEALGWLSYVLDHEVTPAEPVEGDPVPPLPERYEDWPEYRRRYGAILHRRWTEW